MTLFETITERLRAIFRREPQADTWLLPESEVTRAVESGRNLAAYDERLAPPPSAPSLPRTSLELESFLLEPLAEPARKLVISDDVVHGGPVVAAPAKASDKPLEAKTTRKRWWRRAA